MANKIYIGNISPSTTDKDLYNLFSNSGSIISAKVNFGIDNKIARNGYIVMNDEEDLEKAIARNNNILFKGNRIRVIKAHPIDQNSEYFSNKNRFRNFYKR